MATASSISISSVGMVGSGLEAGASFVSIVSWVSVICSPVLLSHSVVCSIFSLIEFGVFSHIFFVLFVLFLIIAIFRINNR